MPAAARVGVAALVVSTVAAGALVWLAGSSNPFTPAGYVGYLTRGAVFGRSSFYATQRGPTSPGRGWLLRVANVSVTPYTYSDDFVGDDAVLSRDNLMIAFRVHTVWRVDDQRVPLFMERFSTTVTNRGHEEDPDAIVKVAYGNFIREPLRTYARDEVQRRNGLEVKDALVAIGDAVLARIRAYALNSPVRHHQRGRGQLAQPHGGLHPRGADGRAGDGHDDGRSGRGRTLDVHAPAPSQPEGPASKSMLG